METDEAPLAGHGNDRIALQVELEGLRHDSRRAIGCSSATAPSIARAMARTEEVRSMRREGLLIDSQTLYDRTVVLACCVQWRAHDRFARSILDAPVVFADETPWPLLGKGAHDEIHGTRATDAGKALLGGYRGIAVTDGYGVYDALEKRFAGLRMARCCAHIRRKLVDCESAFLKATEQIAEAALADPAAVPDQIHIPIAK